MLPSDVCKLEQRSLGANGEPTLANAYELLLKYWHSGNQDPEVGLHLMFLAWYLMLEPGHLTGLDAASEVAEGLQSTFNEVHSHFAKPLANDAEFLYVAGLMAQLTPWLLGDEKLWSELSEDYRTRYRSQWPQGISPEIFDQNNAYGDYFARQARVEAGY